MKEMVTTLPEDRERRVEEDKARTQHGTAVGKELSPFLQTVSSIPTGRSSDLCVTLR